MKKVMGLAAAVMVACSQPQPPPVTYQSEVRFEVAERVGEEWRPSAFTFALNGISYRVVWGGQPKDSAVTTIDVDLDEGFFLEEVLFAPYAGDILLAFQESNAESGTSYLARMSTGGEAVWRQWVPGFNMAEPVVFEGTAYVSGIGGVGKINLEDGEYVWKHEGLYDRYRINAYRPAQLVDSTVVFAHSSRSDSTPKTLVFDRASGELLRVENADSR